MPRFPAILYYGTASWWCVTTCVRLQPPAPIHVKMEGPALLLTLAPVMWGGQECSVKQVGETLVSNYIMPCMHGLYWNGASTVWYSLLQLLFHCASYIYRNHSKPHFVGQPYLSLACWNGLIPFKLSHNCKSEVEFNLAKLCWKPHSPLAVW